MPVKATTATALALLGGLLASGTHAADNPEEDRWALCPPISDNRLTNLPPWQPSSPGATEASADELFSESNTVTRLQGNVVIRHENATLSGQRAEYFRNEERLNMEGGIDFRSEGLQIDSEQVEFFLGEQRGSFEQASFHLPASHAFGSAERIAVDGPQQVRLEDLRYTTCPPRNPAWELRAGELQLDRADNTGEAWHATLRFQGVPFFYSPYLNFPLEGRKSGLLPPTYGTSDEGGNDISLPFYWNIAPNQDATITPRHISRRGGMLMGEYRYLGPQSEGRLNASYLPDDALYGDERNYVSLHHDARISQGWSSTVVLRRVSDADYFLDDLAGGDESGSQTHLERLAELSYRDRYWRFLGRAQSYQNLSGSVPYQRLPQLQLSGRSARRPNRLHYSLQSEAVRFRHDNLDGGDRFDIKPQLSLPLGGAGWFVTPGVAWRHTVYQLEQDGGDGERLERSLPITSLDSGLIFERPLQLGDTALLQTLEPRLFYLHVPYEDQSALPLFDTDELDFSFSQLFSDNRFSGADRQGDADQLTTALSSALYDELSGRERARLSLGQVHYFDDRRVSLDGTTGEQSRSDIIAELSLNPLDNLNLRLTEQWDPQEEQSERFNARLRYAPGPRKRISLGYRFHRERALEQADIALFWPLNRQWRLLGRYQYDIENEASLDTIGGVEYESCCWSVQLLARAQRDALDEDLNQSIYLTLELKGLASLGRGLEQSVEHGILGYD